MTAKQITVLGVGNILLSDVSIIDGNVLGLGLLGTIVEADHLIVTDAVKNGGSPGAVHRLEGADLPRRILAKNSLHQVDLLEALTLSQALAKGMPKTVIIGVEPADIKTLSIELTPATAARLEEVVDMVIAELDCLGVKYQKKGNTENVSCNPI